MELVKAKPKVRNRQNWAQIIEKPTRMASVDVPEGPRKNVIAEIRMYECVFGFTSNQNLFSSILLRNFTHDEQSYQYAIWYITILQFLSPEWGTSYKFNPEDRVYLTGIGDR